MAIYNITPVSKPRMTRSDKWKQRPAVMKYRAFKDACRENKVIVENEMSYTFFIPMPKSFSKKKQNELVGKPHTQTPDIDNLLKALFDAVLIEDSHIWNVKEVKKVWSKEGKIEII